MMPLSKRNAETADAAIRELNAKLHEGLEVIARQQATLSMLVQRMTQVEAVMLAYQANLKGRGPTVT